VRAITTSVRDDLIADVRCDTASAYVIRPVTTDLHVRAGNLCHTHALRAYDAVQLAPLLSLRDDALAAGAAGPSLYLLGCSPPSRQDAAAPWTPHTDQTGGRASPPSQVMERADAREARGWGGGTRGASSRAAPARASEGVREEASASLPPAIGRGHDGRGHVRCRGQKTSAKPRAPSAFHPIGGMLCAALPGLPT
jgi:hypothetical protein